MQLRERRVQIVTLKITLIHKSRCSGDGTQLFKVKGLSY